MKNFTKIVGITVTVAVIGLSFASCADDEKKAANAAGAAQTIGAVADAVGAGKAVEAAKNAAGKVTASASGGAAVVAPATDFIYKLTDDQEGVRIEKYTGKGGNIIVPDTIEGFPVTEMHFDNIRGLGRVFENTAVTSVVLPDSLAEFFNKNRAYGVGDEIFQDSAQLQTVTFPKGLTKIPRNWFSGCTALVSITIPDTVTLIESSAFTMSGLTSIVIPEGVTVIGGGAFSGCKNLTSVTLPESIQVVDGGAFAGCTSLETVNLPSHQFNIGGRFHENPFQGCTKLSLAAQKAIKDAADPDISKYQKLLNQ